MDKKFVIFHIEGGVGKNIVATSVVRAIKKTYPDREIVVVSPYPEVFLHNPIVYRTYKMGICSYFYEDYILNKDTIILKHDPYSSNDVLNKKCNLALAWCNSLQIKFDGEKPELFFSIIEEQNVDLLLKKYSFNKPIIAVQCNGGMGYSENHITFNWFRDVPVAYFQPIINKFKDNFTFLQIRSNNQTVLENTVQIDLSLREVFLLLSKVNGAICIDSLTQHVLAAFNKPSLVLWVGNTPKVFGYIKNKNIIGNYKHETQNIESYLDPYPLITKGYQCPSNYNPYELFNLSEIESSFSELYLK